MKTYDDDSPLKYNKMVLKIAAQTNDVEIVRFVMDQS